MQETIQVVFWFYDDADESADDREAVVNHNDTTFNRAIGHHSEFMHPACVPRRGDIVSVPREDTRMQTGNESMRDTAYFVDDLIYDFSVAAGACRRLYVMLSPSDNASLKTGLEGVFGDG